MCVLDTLDLQDITPYTCQQYLNAANLPPLLWCMLQFSSPSMNVEYASPKFIWV